MEFSFCITPAANKSQENRDDDFNHIVFEAPFDAHRVWDSQTDNQFYSKNPIVSPVIGQDLTLDW